MQKEGRKKQARSNKQTNTNKQTQTNTNKAKQHSTPKAVTFPKKNELPQVGLEPTTLYTLDMLERCRRKEEASEVIQTTEQSNTAHPRQSLCR